MKSFARYLLAPAVLLAAASEGNAEPVVQRRGFGSSSRSEFNVSDLNAVFPSTVQFATALPQSSFQTQAAGLYDETLEEVGFGNGVPLGDDITDPVVFTFTIGPDQRLAAGPATLTLTAFGDFNGGGFEEWIDVDVDGVSFGRVLNGNSADDSFNFPDGDTGTQYIEEHEGSASIAEADFETMIADGELEVTLTFGEDVSNIFNDPDEFVRLNLTYEIEAAAVVPEPSSIALFGCGALGLAGYSWRKRRRGKAMKK